MQAIASNYSGTHQPRMRGAGHPGVLATVEEGPGNVDGRALDSGIRAVLVSVSAEGLDSSWLGKEIDSGMLKSLREVAKRRGINLAGEGGEYETTVLDSPLHARSMQIVDSRRTLSATAVPSG